MIAGTASERRADARTWDGFRSVGFARSTGTLVVVVDGYAAGLESPGDGGCRWFTVCDDHDRLVGHPSLSLARYHASAPEEWCGVCGGTEDADEPEFEVVAADVAIDSETYGDLVEYDDGRRALVSHDGHRPRPGSIRHDLWADCETCGREIVRNGVPATWKTRVSLDSKCEVAR